MSTFITEDWLRERHSLARHTEIHLPADSRLTPAAQELVKARALRIKFLDAAGSLFAASADATGSDIEARQAVHALTGTATRMTPHCALCQQPVTQKPEALTHLDADSLVPKSDPRIALRAALDSTMAVAVWAQTVFDPDNRRSTLAHYLADIRSCLGNVLRATVTGEPVPAIAMGEIDEERLHELSHHPLAVLGHDHIVPALEHGATVAQLNLLRTRVRECELQAAQCYADVDRHTTRPDVLQALNRLSSAVYVLMILVVLQERGQAIPKLESTR